MGQIERLFRLASVPGHGVRCDENGLFVGEISLLERSYGKGEIGEWRPRPVTELNRELSQCYGLPVDFDRKVAGLATIARALDRGDFARAQIAALHLCIPEPLALANSARTEAEVRDLARKLLASDLLKAEWDSAKHPRWPAKSPNGTGGQFAPFGSGELSVSGEMGASVIPAQFTITAPLDIPLQEKCRFRARSWLRHCPFLTPVRVRFRRIPILIERSARKNGLMRKGIAANYCVADCSGMVTIGKWVGIIVSA